ncbi:hypothetical protein F3J23_08220 [Chryseobacterium sp. Tr-659]|uniref:hypothetical protein n=1 Tax=Chryseobacterium sp. Tr-659 TaxID=2608340 RepID=UPI001424975A|nr:hypothetical protein [Chryseobacterium sp. Tr-659]NIF05427.1 hypothetical protein [Chryseobacterium sp. Tr-659]
MKKMVIVLLGMTMNCYSQKIRENETLNTDGFAVSFYVINKETVNVRKVEYDRYKVAVNVKNNTGKSFNIRLSSTSDLLGSLDDTSDKVGLFELSCVNATGARLTSKRISVGLKPHRIRVAYWEYNSDRKYVQSYMTVTAGYYLDSQESVNDEAIFIVPKGEQPDVLVRKLQ